ncbi:MAG: hypothetical protein VKN60_07175 [Cyanobacteriota bacterium]|nr:hypothetical protein [Cyanobacteriota bacterium]
MAFAPWLAFLVIAHDSLFRVKLGLIVALILSVGMGVARLHRGVILWAGLFFFSAATVAVVGFNNPFVLKYLGVLASGTLAASAWLTILLKKPFTLDYAKAHTDPSHWTSPSFIKANLLISSVWAASFTLNAFLALGKAKQFIFSAVIYEMLSYGVLLGTAAFTSWRASLIRSEVKSNGL